MRRNPFFRRLGCAFASLNLLGFALFFLFISWAANQLGVANLPGNLLHLLLPLGIALLVAIVVLAVLGVLGLRRVFTPLDDLLEAAGRVAEGDYAVRVSEHGPKEVRSLARAFNDMASRLHLADERRRNLLADVTHELRSPLTVLQGNLEGMLDGVYPADETNLRALLDETNILSGLVEDLRTVALAESGALRLKKEPTDLIMLVHDALNAFQAQARTANVTLVVDAPETFPRLELDPGRIRQVITNLVANALRYAPAGSRVTVRIGLLPGQVMLEVIDEGPGIPAQDLPHVFERFYKSTDSGGMGLGLAIVRHLVSAHDGTIEALSPAGQGTTMRIALPLGA